MEDDIGDMQNIEGDVGPLDAERSDDFENEKRDLSLLEHTILSATSKTRGTEDG